MNNVFKMVLALSIFSAPLMVRAQDTGAAPSNPTTIQEAKQDVKQDKAQLNTDKQQFGKGSAQVKADRAKLRADKQAKRQMKKKSGASVPTTTAPTTPGAQ